MKFLQVSTYGHKIRRSVWPEYDYVVIDKKKHTQEMTVTYWNNDEFQWVDIRLTLEDLIASDWMEA